MELNTETYARITAAADQLYTQADRATFPTVDAVRKLAKVNMNDASVGMKEWRRAQTNPVARVVVAVPEAVTQANAQAVAALWQAAMDTASAALRAAQAGWEAERAEGDAIAAQLGDAYEAQAAELDAVQRAALAQVEAISDQLATLQARTSGDQARLDAALAERNQAREEAAELRGELRGMVTQRQEFMDSLTASRSPSPATVAKPKK